MELIRNLAAKCLSEMCIVRLAKVVLKDRNVVVVHECVVLVVWGEKRECLQKMLPRDEVARCLSGILRRSRHSLS